MATTANSFNTILFAEFPRALDVTLPSSITTVDGLQALIDAGLAQTDASAAVITADAAAITAGDAQDDADQALINVADPTYLADRLSQSSAEIIANSTAFLTIGTNADNGITIGSNGLFAKASTVTTFSIDNAGNATFAGELSAATGSFSGSITVGATIDGGASIGASNGTSMISATSAAQSTADTADTNASAAVITANNAETTADSAQTDATTAISDASIADGKAVSAQTDATTALTRVGDNDYLAARLSEAGTSIAVTSSNQFILIGSINDGLYLGSTGLFGRKSSTTTFSIATDGTATFAGELSAATGSFSGSVTVGATIDGGASIGTSTGTSMISATTTAQNDATTAISDASIADSKAVDAQTDATTAIGDASDAQNTADSALANVGSYSYLASILDNASTTIQAASSTFILIGNTSTGLYLGSNGLFGKKSGATTFSIDNAGNATFAGALSAATGSFSGSITVGASIDGGASIGTSTGTSMISATSTAQSTANTGVTNAATADAKAVTADGKAVSAQTDATTAISDASDAQDDADQALSNVGSYSYLASILDNASTTIQAASSTFILIGNTSTGLYLGSGGLYGKKSGATTFSIDSSGNAIFKGSLTGATGTFSGTVSSTYQIYCISAANPLSTGAAIYGKSTGTNMFGVVGQSNSSGAVFGEALATATPGGWFRNNYGGLGLVVEGKAKFYTETNFLGRVWANDLQRENSTGDIGASTRYWTNIYASNVRTSRIYKGTNSINTTGTLELWNVSNSVWVGSFRYSFY